MQLKLTIVSYQRLSPSVESTYCVSPEQAAVIGRSPDCNWYLPDPNKILSSRHAEIRFSEGVWSVFDTSTNGVFLNGDSVPIGRGNSASIKSGDTVHLGDFEVSVGFSGEKPVEAAAVQADAELAGGRVPLARTGAGPVDEVVEMPAAQPVGDDFREFLGAGLGERLMADTHVGVQEPSIPGEWHWGEAFGSSPDSALQQNGPMHPDLTAPDERVQPSSGPNPDALAALVEGLGLTSDRVEGAGPEFYRDLGNLTRILLDRLLDMIHLRARQKQELRVAQTLFKRSDNNPLKFSATPQDALDSLLLRPHSANLGAVDAVNRAFDDLLSHEQALLKGVEAVVSDILADPSGDASNSSTGSFFARRKTLETMKRHRAWQHDAYGNTDKMLRSEVFVDAYEKAAGQKEESFE